MALCDCGAPLTTNYDDRGKAVSRSCTSPQCDYCEPVLGVFDENEAETDDR